jgi:hypothetical protein
LASGENRDGDSEDVKKNVNSSDKRREGETQPQDSEKTMQDAEKFKKQMRTELEQHEEWRQSLLWQAYVEISWGGFVKGRLEQSPCGLLHPEITASDLDLERQERHMINFTNWGSFISETLQYDKFRQLRKEKKLGGVMEVFRKFLSESWSATGAAVSFEEEVIT